MRFTQRHMVVMMTITFASLIFAAPDMRAAMPAAMTATAPPTTLTASDFVDVLKKSKEAAESIGFERMSVSEQAALGEMLKQTFLAGYRACSDNDQPTAPRTPGRTVPPGPGAPPNSAEQAQPPEQLPTNSCFESKIDGIADDIVKLRNGTILQITGLPPVLVLPGKRAILFRTNAEQKLWIEGKKAYRCVVTKQPEITVQTHSVRESRIFSVSTDGALIKLLDGSAYEVDMLDRIHTMLWLPAQTAVIADDSEMLAPDRGSPPVKVNRIN